MDDELKLSPVWREAVKQLLLSGTTYGSVIHKKVLIQLSGLREPETVERVPTFNLQLMNFISGVKKEFLIQHRMSMVTNYDETYSIVLPRDQTSRAVDFGGKVIAKEMQRMAETVQYTAVELLTDDERRKNTDAAAKIAMLIDMTKKKADNLRLIVGLPVEPH